MVHAVNFRARRARGALRREVQKCVQHGPGGEAGGKGACRDRHVCTCALRSNTTHRSATTHPKPTRGRRGQCRGGGDREEYTSDYM